MTKTGSAIPKDSGWIERVRGRAWKTRVPLSATLELTSRCNLRCRHCYLGDQAEQHKKRALERDTEAVKASLREWADAGALYLLITGGDPMMRKDFTEIYRFAREQGMLVTVFCDGILVTDKIISLFQELPPRKVEISIYGATPETYESVTRVPGSHAAAWRGIHRLLDAGITVALKTVMMTLNEHEMEDMAAQAESLGLKFRHDAAIFPCLPDSSKDPLNLRVSPERVVSYDLADPKRLEHWQKAVHKLDQFPVSDRLYTCGAGATGFYCDPYGGLSPCLMTTHYRYDQGTRSFQDLWDHELGFIRQKKRARSDSCLTGPQRAACTHCPAMNYLESGDEEQESDYMRETTLLRYKAILKSAGTGDHNASVK